VELEDPAGVASTSGASDGSSGGGDAGGNGGGVAGAGMRQPGPGLGPSASSSGNGRADGEKSASSGSGASSSGLSSGGVDSGGSGDGAAAAPAAAPAVTAWRLISIARDASGDGDALPGRPHPRVPPEHAILAQLAALRRGALHQAAQFAVWGRHASSGGWDAQMQVRLWGVQG
jgi:hypothetical protein